MRRRIAHIVFVTGFGTVALAAGVLAALTVARPGRALLARTVTQLSNDIFRGNLTIGEVSGNFLTSLSLRGVYLRDSAGAVVAEVPWRAGSSSPACSPNRR